MRKPLLPLLFALALSAGALAQSSKATSAPAQNSVPQKVKKAAPSALDRATSWLCSGGQEAMKRLKASQAEVLIRTAPNHFAGLKATANDLATKIGKGMSASLTEKKNLALQLWRLRGSLDVMALLDPHTLETLTGIDAKTLTGLQRTATNLAKSLGSLTGTVPNG